VPELHADVEQTLAVTLAAPLGDLDDLCCGAAGRAEALLTAAHWLDRPDLATAAWARTSLLVRRADVDGAYRLFADVPPDVDLPGLFPGSAGIGYHLLRLARPLELPALLLWD
jgi:lantibiotic modifying enzyme